jgi:hypothetical protein
VTTASCFLLSFLQVDLPPACTRVGNFRKTIEARVDAGSRFRLSVTYSNDGDVLMRPGERLKTAAMLTNIFLIMYGASYLDIGIEIVVLKFKATTCRI